MEDEIACVHEPALAMEVVKSEERLLDDALRESKGEKAPLGR